MIPNNLSPGFDPMDRGRCSDKTMLK